MPRDLQEEEDNEDWEVEKIYGVKRNLRKKKVECLIKWKGKPASKNSWEELDRVPSDKRDLLEAFDEAIERLNENKRSFDDEDDFEDKEMEQDEYVVEDLLGIQWSLENKRVEYFIKWDGWDNSYNNWEPEENMYCPDMIKFFRDSANHLNKTFGGSSAKKPPRSGPKSKRQASDSENTDDDSPPPKKRAGPKSRTSGSAPTPSSSKPGPASSKRPGPKSMTVVSNDSDDEDEAPTPAKRPGPKSKTLSVRKPGPASKSRSYAESDDEDDTHKVTSSSSVNNNNNKKTDSDDEDDKGSYTNGNNGNKKGSGSSDEEEEVVKKPGPKSRTLKPGPASKRKPGPKSKTSYYDDNSD